MFAFSSILWLEYASCYLLPISFQKQFCLPFSKLHTAAFHNFNFLCCLSFACFSTQLFFKQTVSPVILLRASRTLFSLNNIPSIFLGDTPIFLGAEDFNEACLFFAEANANNFWTFGNKHMVFAQKWTQAWSLVPVSVWTLLCLSRLFSCWLADKCSRYFFPGLYNPYLGSWRSNLSCSGT